MLVYLADLGHNQLTLSSDVYPLGVANLAAYATAYHNARSAPEFVLFREPQDLRSALDRRIPDILGLSSYAWNHNLSISMARYAKRRSQGSVLTLLGGPNYPLTAGEQESFLRGMSDIDIAVRGPTYEGERAFLNVIRRFAEAGPSLDDIQSLPLAGNDWICRRSAEFVRGEQLDRISDLDEIPSPYIGRWLEPFFQTGYFPILQIARGCPFSCTFCNSSDSLNNKIHAHSVENVKRDLLYTAQRVRPEITLCFADDNFGMYPRDEEIADYLAYLQDRFGWPHYVRTTTGKNQHERIIRVMRKTRGILPMTAAVQSLNPQVLVNIKRSNIKLQAYSEIQKELLSQGMQAYGELILCLPGETKASFMQAVRDLLDSGVKRVSAHQLMLLHGAPLSNPEERSRYGFQTRFRVVARNIGDYTGEPVIETEELVVETPDFVFQDYLDTRVFHLLLTIFYYEGNFEEAFEFARQFGVTPYDVVVRMQAILSSAGAEFQRLIEEFLSESRAELFDTAEECLQWARTHFNALVDGSSGGNLLSKYSMIGRFYSEYHSIDFLELAIHSMLDEHGESRALLRTVFDYLRCTVLQAPFRESLEAVGEWTTSFDVEAWRRDQYQRPLQDYRFVGSRSFPAVLASERKALLQNRLSTFGEHPSGLGKFTRSMFARDLRRSVITAPGVTQ